MSELKLEVGKKYKSKCGEVFTLVYISEKGHLALENDVGLIVTIFKENLLDTFSEYTEPKKLSGWINVYKSCTCETKEEADRKAGANRLACIDLSQFNEGEGLE